MSTQVKEKSAGKHASFVEAQLGRAESRIRMIDLSAALLGFLAGTLAYAVAMILLDRLFVLSGATRQVALLLYLLAAGLYLAFAVVRPLLWRVNPYFAARQLEDTLPGSRNHVINWIDLRDQKLPAVLKTTLGQRAARDLSRTDVDRAIVSTRALVSGGVAGLFAVIFITLFVVFGPSPFGSYLSRAFAPFGKTTVATRTQLAVIRPEGGNAVITIGNPVTIVAEVGGRIPNARDRDAPCLLYRHDPSEPYRQRYLQRDDSGQEWAATVGPLDVGAGFWYRVSAGDATTKEYQVKARAAPGIGSFQATYHYRPYVGKADRIVRDKRKLEDLAGTRVTILARTNRTVRGGALDCAGTEVSGERVPGDPQALRFRLVLERSGKYRIRFTSSEGERYVEPVSYAVTVIPDNAPEVHVTQPARDVNLPLDGHLEIKGEATDDIGIARLALYLQLVGGKQKLQARPYLIDKLGKPGYGTPRRVDYQHLLELPTLVDEQGKPVELKAGAVVEYWLEAADACDFPAANVTLSTPRYKITIGDGKETQPQKKDREEAQKRQAEHDKKEQDKIKQENAARQEQREKEEKQNEADRKQQEKDKKEAQASDKDGKPNEDRGEQNPESKGDAGKGSTQGDKPGDKDTQKKADDLKNALDRSGKKDDGSGQGQGEGDGKDKDRGKSSGDKDGKPKDKGKSEDGNNPRPGNQGSEGGKDGKDKPKAGGPKSQPGDKGGTPGDKRTTPDKPPRQGDNIREGANKEGGVKGKEFDKTRPTGQEDRSKAAATNDKDKNGVKGTDSDTGEKPDRPRDKNAKNNRKPPRPEDATPSDVEKAAKDLKSTDPKKRGRAAEDLKNIQEKAKDPQARQAAGKCLAEAKNKAGRPGKDGDEEKGKPGAPRKKDNDARGSGDKDKAREPKKGEGDGPPGKPKGRQDRPRGPNPGGGDRDREGTSNSSTGQDPPKQGKKPVGHRASMLQLEEFRKKVDRDVLKKMNMSREQFERFLRDYADMVRRQQAEKGPLETLPSPSRNVAPPGGSSARPGKRPDGKADDLRNEGRPKPPPGYRDAYAEFLKRLSR